jgi:hypothetical protein
LEGDVVREVCERGRRAWERMYVEECGKEVVALEKAGKIDRVGKI